MSWDDGWLASFDLSIVAKGQGERTRSLVVVYGSMMTRTSCMSLCPFGPSGVRLMTMDFGAFSSSSLDTDDCSQMGVGWCA